MHVWSSLQTLSAVFYFLNKANRNSSLPQPHLAPPSPNPLSTCFIHQLSSLHSSPAFFSQIRCSKGAIMGPTCLALLTNIYPRCTKIMCFFFLLSAFSQPLLIKLTDLTGGGGWKWMGLLDLIFARDLEYESAVSYILFSHPSMWACMEHDVR